MRDQIPDSYQGCYRSWPTERIIHGVPAETAILDEVELRSAQRVFLLTTRSLTGKPGGVLERITEALGSRHVGTFGEVSAHSPRTEIVEAAEQARSAGADLVVSVGGGSVTDAAKAVCFCLWLNLRTAEAMDPYCDDTGTRVADIEPPQGAIRFVCVPTTLTAAEFTINSGLTSIRHNEDGIAERVKEVIRHPLLAPLSIILDPAATLSTPLPLLLASGMRSVDHAVETYCSPKMHPATEATSVQALRLLWRSLQDIQRDPENLTARMEAQFGMWQSIIPFAGGVSCGASHGIGAAIGSAYNVLHGETSCMILPTVLVWNSKVNAERQAELAAAIGERDRCLADLIRGLIVRLNLPDRLRLREIPKDDFGFIAKRALHYEVTTKNPRPITGPEQVMEILELAW